jgi:hypothetical protein
MKADGGSRMPPDMLAKSIRAASLSDRIEAALDAGTISAEQGTIAYTRLAAVNAAQAGRIPMAAAIEQLKGRDTRKPSAPFLASSRYRALSAWSTNGKGR